MFDRNETLTNKCVIVALIVMSFVFIGLAAYAFSLTF